MHLLLVLCALFFGSMSAQAESVYLVDNQGERLKVAQISFSDGQSGTTYKLDYDESLFGDYFLAMRPFRCHEGERLLCRQPYPYPLERTLTNDNLIALEYDLIFISRALKEYGIDPYHGRYYVLEKTDNGYKGTIRAVDLNALAAPPDDGVIYPITEDILDEMEPESVSFPTLIIE